MDPAFQAAIRPMERIVLRLRLQEFTLGHWFLLARYCPYFIDPELRGSEPALPLAVLICSLPPKKAEKLLRKRWLPLFCLTWGWLNRKRSIEKEWESFFSYLNEACSLSPKINVPQSGKAHETNSPLGFWALSFLMAEFGCSETEALDMPMSRAFALRAARGESLGHFTLQSARGRNLWRYFNERRQANIASGTTN